MSTTRRLVSMAEMTDEQRRVHRAGEALHRDGASPGGTLELLAAIVEDETWRKVADVKGEPFDGRFRDFVSARPPFGLGFDPAQLLKVIALRHPHEGAPHIAERMERMRGKVRELLNAQAELMQDARDARRAAVKAADEVPLPTSGAVGRSRVRSDNIKANPGGTSESYLRRRLARDHPELHARVASGELTANAAAVEAGIKPRTTTLRIDSPESIAAALRRLMSAEDIARMVAILLGGD